MNEKASIRSYLIVFLTLLNGHSWNTIISQRYEMEEAELLVLLGKLYVISLPNGNEKGRMKHGNDENSRSTDRCKTRSS
jgi:hypothetical protein